MSVTEGGRKGRSKAEKTAGDATDKAEEQAPGRDEQDSGGSSGGGETITGEIKAAVREAAIEVLKPVARKATTSAAKLAVTQGPKLLDKVGPKVTDKVADAGGAGALVKG